MLLPFEHIVIHCRGWVWHWLGAGMTTVGKISPWGCPAPLIWGVFSTGCSGGARTWFVSTVLSFQGFPSACWQPMRQACLMNDCLQTGPKLEKLNRMSAGKCTPQKQPFVSWTIWCLQWSPLCPGRQSKREERLNNAQEVSFHTCRHMMGLMLCA